MNASSRRFRSTIELLLEILLPTQVKIFMRGALSGGNTRVFAPLLTKRPIPLFVSPSFPFDPKLSRHQFP